ncbi:MAG TPA: hypothetical protein VGC05_05005 [Mycobacterium sp.]
MRRLVTGALAVVTAVLLSGMLSGFALPVDLANASVVEHFGGQTFTLTPTNWHGATDCAIVSPTKAYCFDSNAAFNTFTDVPRDTNGAAVVSQGASPTAPISTTATPDATGTCDGWAKIWNGTNWTGRGLAFEDYGYQQYLGDYVTVPFEVMSWFTDGERGYAAMTDCWGVASSPGNITLHTNGKSVDDGGIAVGYIELYSGKN